MYNYLYHSFWSSTSGGWVRNAAPPAILEGCNLLKPHKSCEKRVVSRVALVESRNKSWKKSDCATHPWSVQRYSRSRRWFKMPCVPTSLYLVGGMPTPLKNILVSWDDYSQHMEK